MDEGPPKADVLDRAVSWAAFALLVATAAGFAWYVPRNRDAILQTFVDFKLELPRSTAIACAVPTFVIVGLGVIAVAAGLVVQVISRSKRSASLFHFLLVFTLGVLFLAHREAMGNAFLTLVEGLSGRAAGR